MLSAKETAAPIARVVLTGFMGAGKTTLGALLADALGWQFADTDQVLSAAEGAPVAELFARLGEPGFRGLEAATIARLLREDRMVIALGGGALETPGTRAVMAATPATHIVFLETPLAIAVARCLEQQGGAVRPLLQDGSDLDGRELAARFERRAEHYRIAHQTLSTASQTPEALLRLLLDSLPLRFTSP